MLIEEVKMFHSRNPINDSSSWNLSVNSFQTKCLILLDKVFQTK